MTRAAASPARDVQHAFLRTAIDRFATPHSALLTERRSLPETPRERLLILLREIDETVMPRLVLLSENDHQIATLTVSNRRLFAVDVQTGVAENSDEQEDQDVAKQLLEVTKTATSMSSKACSDHAPSSDSGSGLGVTKLREQLGFDASGDDISQLTGLLEPVSLARMTWTDGPAQHNFSGAESWRALLETHVDRITRNIAAQDAQKLSAAATTTGMAIPLSKDELLVVACQKKSGVAAVMPRQEGFKAISTWQITAQIPR